MAENTVQSRSRTIGIIRLIIFIILVVVAVFFLVVFIRNRQADKTAVELTQLSQEDKKDSGSDENKDEKKQDSDDSSDSKEGVTEGAGKEEAKQSESAEPKKETEPSKAEEDSSQTIVIPGGIDDAPSKPKSSDSSSGQNEATKKDAPSAAMPEAGMGSDVLAMAALISIATYVIVQRKVALGTLKS